LEGDYTTIITKRTHLVKGKSSLFFVMRIVERRCFMKGTIDKEKAERERLNIVKLQIGNPFDTNGARLVEALLVAKMISGTTGDEINIYIYNRHGQPWLAQAHGNAAPDFDEGADYSTCALPLERNEAQATFPHAAKHFGVDIFWLQNNWWTQKVRLLNKEPLETVKD
jgi:hypothetical protein